MTYKGSFVQCTVLLLVLDICDPWPDTVWIPDDVLLIHRILVGLEREQVSFDLIDRYLRSKAHNQVEIWPIVGCPIHLRMMSI